MPRTAPVMPTEAPGNFNTGALFNATAKAVGDWQINVPRFKGYASSSQALSSGTTYVALTLDSEYLDSDAGHSTVTNTSRYTCQVAGWYWVQGTASLPNGSGNRSLQLTINGTAAPGTTLIASAATGNSWAGMVSGLVQLAVGDYLELQIWQNSSGSLSTNTTLGLQPTMSAIWISN